MEIAIYAGSFNPPGLHHCQIIDLLINIFDKIFIVPCGQSPSKKGFVENRHRIEMIRLSFAETDITKFDWSDALNDTFVRPYELDSEYCHSDIVWHIIGSDVIMGGAQKNSSIHNDWENGHDLWDKLNFAIITRPGYILCDGGLPPKHMIIKARICGSSSIIRDAIRANYDLSKLLPSDVIDYIIENKLYDYTQ